MANYNAIAKITPRRIVASRAPVQSVTSMPEHNFTQDVSEQTISQCSIVDLGTVVIASGSTATTYYQMRGVDPDCILTLTYRSWIVTGSPDYAGAQYSGPRCGVSPLTNIVVVDTWSA